MTQAIPKNNHISYLAANFISILGDVIGTLSISWWVISHTESSVTMASIMAPSLVARIIGGPLFGTIADFMSRKKIMVFSDLASALLWVGLFFYYLSGNFNPVFLSTYFFFIILLQSLLKAAAGGMLADLGEVENLVRKIQSSSSMARIVGAASGALFLQFLGVKAALIFNMLTFLMAAGLVASIKVKEHFELNKKIQFSEFFESFKYIKEYPSFINIALWLVLLQFFVAGFPVLLPAYVKLVKEMPAWYLGALELSLGLGILLGTLVIIPWVKRKSQHRSLEISFLLMSVGAVFMALSDSLLLPVIGILLIQSGFVTGLVPLNSKIIMSLPGNLRSRVSSLIASVIDISAFVGLIVTSFSFGYFGHIALFSTMACFYFLFFIVLISFKDRIAYAG